jgi:seryl-tRNA synthetase
LIPVFFLYKGNKKGSKNMYDFDLDIEAKAKKIDEKIKKLQEEKRQLAENIKAEKQRETLAHKVGKFFLKEVEANPSKYSDLQDALDSVLNDDFERSFFKLPLLPDGDPRRPKPRGRRKKEAE